MFSPSDFNEDVSVFKDSQGTPFGNYCSAPVEPQYIAEPDHTTYIEGRAPLNTLPAQWWNWLLNQITKKLNGVNKYVGNLFSELSNLLGLMGITPTEPSTPTGNQLSTGFLNNYPNVISKFMHTIASVWTKQNQSTVGTVTTTQINKLAVFEDINESDSATTPATVTDTYNTKYIDKLPVDLGGTGGNTPESAMVNLASPLTKIASQTGQLSDMVIFDRENSNSTHTVAKMDLVELGRLISSSNVNVPVITTNSTVITGTALSTSESFGVFFTDNINGANSSTPLQLTYNNTLIPVKACKNGALIDVYAHQITDNGTVVYRYLQAYTTLNLIYDGANFVIIGNPIVLSSSDYVIYADGFYKWLNYSTKERFTWKFDVNGKPIYRRSYVCTTAITIADEWYIVAGWSNFATDYGVSDIYITKADFGNANNIPVLLQRSDLWGKFFGSPSYQVKVGDVLTLEFTKATDTAGTIPPFSN